MCKTKVQHNRHCLISFTIATHVIYTIYKRICYITVCWRKYTECYSYISL